VSVTDAIQEGRTHLQAIENLLFIQNEHLEKIANKSEAPKPPARVIGAPQYRTYHLEEEKLKRLVDPIQGLYYRLNHWAYQQAAAGIALLYSGPVGKEGINNAAAFADAQLMLVDSTIANAERGGLNPNELIIPPEMCLYGLLGKAGETSINISTLQLSL